MRERVHDEHAVEQRRLLRHHEHPHEGRDATERGEHRRERHACAVRFGAQPREVEEQHDQRGHDHDGLGRAELEELEVIEAHSQPPFRNASKSGEPNAGTITSSSTRG